MHVYKFTTPDGSTAHVAANSLRHAFVELTDLDFFDDIDDLPLKIEIADDSEVLTITYPDELPPLDGWPVNARVDEEECEVQATVGDWGEWADDTNVFDAHVICSSRWRS